MRIGIDARFLTHPQKGGFKSYSENLVSALATIDKVNTYILYLDRSPNQLSQLPNQPNFEYRVIHGEIPIVGMPLREQFGLPFYAMKDRLDLLHSPCLTAPLYLKCAPVVTIHDMIWHSPYYFSKAPASIKRKMIHWYYYHVPQFVARNACFVLTVSHASKNRICEELGISTEKIIVTYEGIKPIFRIIPDNTQISSVQNKFNIQSDYILAIGSADPRKNISTLIQAYAQLSTNLIKKYQLVIIWTHPLLASTLMKQVEELRLSDRVKFIGNVLDDDLVLLYNKATLFVFPSLDEGFGLPPLEAMACGSPCVAANNSSIPEIVGDAALLVNPFDPKGISVAIAKVLSDEGLRNSLSQKGLIRAKYFSWESCAKETIGVYEQVAQSSNYHGR